MKLFLLLGTGVTVLIIATWIGITTFIPKEIPVFPGAQHIDRTHKPAGDSRDQALSFATTASPEQVMDFYKRTLSYHYDLCDEVFREFDDRMGNLIWVVPEQQGADPTQVTVFTAWGAIASHCP